MVRHRFSGTSYVDIGVDMEALPNPSPGNVERNQTRDTTQPPVLSGVDSCMCLGLLYPESSSQRTQIWGNEVELVYELQFRSTEADDKLVIKCATDPHELMDGPAPFFRTAFVDIGVDMEALPYPSPGNAERNQTRDTTEPLFLSGGR
ncbi:hypothetical protein CDAR_259881 [Caerostris darwini]|uniref:Uncharacterized protein n=1 Tax=Caerostris darwini TaxID=1538125 RepID=A0AAV4Q962_9ARAC|nr:hypothetical protein CDAR_259881 [Caerostris darwini]